MDSVYFVRGILAGGARAAIASEIGLRNITARALQH